MQNILTIYTENDPEIMRKKYNFINLAPLQEMLVNENNRKVLCFFGKSRFYSQINKKNFLLIQRNLQTIFFLFFSFYEKKRYEKFFIAQFNVVLCENHNNVSFQLFPDNFFCGFFFVVLYGLFEVFSNIFQDYSYGFWMRFFIDLVGCILICFSICKLDLELLMT